MLPLLRDVAEMQAHCGGSGVNRVHQNLREIEERVMCVQLRTERAGRVDVDLIVHQGAAFRSLNLPPALVDLVDREFFAGAIFGAHPVHILREVTNLVESVPHGELQVALRCARPAV